MSFGAALRQALGRTLEGAKSEASRIMRMDVTSMDKTHGAQLLYGLRSQGEIAQIALGADVDIGGLSRCHMRLEKDEQGAYGRFYGTISAQIPRGSSIDRSGYAAFRNRSRPTLFSNLVWDTEHHPYLALRVRNRTPAAADTRVYDDTSLRAALHAGDTSGPGASRAMHALGVTPGMHATPHPRFFVNVQTDGPVSTDIYQHRLWLDESKGDEWQTVTLALDDFVLTNSGVVSDSQVEMMRERILSVGISVLLQPPSVFGDAKESKGVYVDAVPPPERGASSTSAAAAAAETSSSAASAAQTPNIFRRSDGLPPPPIRLGGSPAAAAGDPVRGSKRSGTHEFDLGIHSIWAVATPEQSAELFS
ncbi:hypothetical protein MCUN1_002300 [Malassezia cuniculi]|uniref:NADH:ubiquinone oxidoreductase intermediate-associated protein 30 domain-containing protein n=1 Tax=Malassezia cuniculi TaxID=948313 RepID=A0AAF0JBM4_9BASI|nr:hypothetical protein MCUN1_002300 [Malassezia cuniculi]